MAAGWFDQQGVRAIFVVAGARFYFRGRRFWEKQLPAVRLWAVDGSDYVAATGKPYPLLLDHGGADLDMALSHCDRNVTMRAPRGPRT
jgi:hypothetical protein